METNSFYDIVVIALATAAISITISKGRIFAPVRGWVASKNHWFGELLSCFYCTSHWLAFIFVMIYQPLLVHKLFVLDLFVSMFVVVAISAVICGVIIRLTSNQEVEKPDESEELQALYSALETASGVIKSQEEKIHQLG